MIRISGSSSILYGLVAVLTAMVPFGCQSSPATQTSMSPSEMFQHEDPAVRIVAARQAGQAKDESAIGFLVDRLGDSESDVRFFSFLALKRITGQTMDYRYYAPLPQRQEAIQRWRQWLRSRQGGAEDAVVGATKMDG